MKEKGEGYEVMGRYVDVFDTHTHECGRGRREASFTRLFRS